MADSAASAPPLPPYLAPYLALLPPNARLLVQAGATDGALARRYRALYPAAGWLAVEANPVLAGQARDYADRVHQADLEQAGDSLYRHLEWADGWIFDGTLEHLREPQRVLERMRAVIQYDACIVARIANDDYWDRPAQVPRHRLAVSAMLALFQDSGFRVTHGIMLNPGPLPHHAEQALRQQATQAGSAPEALLEAALPSHYLIKAMPA